MNGDPRYNNFDLLRVFGSLLVIYGHAHSLTGTAPPSFAANGVATIGVKIFFSISGYLVAESWLRDPNPFRFLARRSLRIFPALIVVTVLTAFLAGPLLTRLSFTDYFGQPGTLYFLNNIRLYITYFLPGLFETNVYPNAVNGSLWSLPVEFAMYLLTPLLISVAVLLRSRAAFAAIAAVFYAADLYLNLIEPRTGLWVFYATDVWTGLALAPYFVIGMLFAVCRIQAAFNIYIAFAALFTIAMFRGTTIVEEAVLILILPYVCLSFGSGSMASFDLTRGTDLSYGLFLYGFPVQQMLAYTLGSQMGPWWNFTLATLICACLAYLSWHLVEKRALAWKPRVKEIAVNSPNLPLPAARPIPLATSGDLAE
jgi:peptidoglycan/LPS O-acetylase OafA/YrhL